ncbi:Transcriptional regulator, MarR family [Olavius algarvensis Delta 1 endosymbiont]|nr:Transcriptional regulator, MarR family [Olavius algarvensis Delta 1 endosymbiont]
MQAKFRGNRKEVRALSTYVKLMRAAESLTSRVHKHLTSAGLTVSQFGVLEAIYHLGPLSQKDLGHKILRSSGNITMVIDNLEKRRLVRRERESLDRRMYIVHLTHEGQTLIGSIFPSHAALITDELSVLKASDQKILGNLCKKIGLGDK